MKFRRQKKEAPLPYVPMADLAFNLLLFFLIIAKSQQDIIHWERASSPGTREITGSRIVVSLDKDNLTYLNGAQIGQRELSDAINEMLGNSTADKRTVLLRVHKNAPAASFEPILEAISQAGGEVFHVLDQER